MPNTVIARINILDDNKPKIITFTDRTGRIIGDAENPGVGADLYEGEVEIPVVDAELEEKELKIPDMERGGNVDLPWVDMEWQDPPPQLDEIDDPGIKQDLGLIAPATAL